MTEDKMIDGEESLEEFIHRVFTELSNSRPTSLIILPIQEGDNQLGVSLHSWGLDVPEVLGIMEIAKGNIILQLLTAHKGGMQ